MIRGARRATGRAFRTWAPRLAHRFVAPECRFLILTTGRTGGELLVSLLGSHPRIMCDSEVLYDHTPFPDQVVRGREALAGLRRAGAYGFKLTRENMLRQNMSDPAAYVRTLHARGYQIVFLRRRDLLQHAISFARAEKLGYRHHRQGQREVFSPVALDPMAVLALMYVTEEVTTWCQDALRGVPHLPITYEDDLVEHERQQAAADEICRFLGLAPAPVRSDLVRITPRTVEEQLSNYDELERVVSVTRYAEYLPGSARV